MKEVTVYFRVILERTILDFDISELILEQKIDRSLVDYEVVDKKGKKLIHYSNPNLDENNSITIEISFNFAKSVPVPEIMNYIYGLNGYSFQVRTAQYRNLVSNDDYQMRIFTDTKEMFIIPPSVAIPTDYKESIKNLWQSFIFMYQEEIGSLVQNIAIERIIVDRKSGIIKLICTGGTNLLDDHKPTYDFILNRYFPS